MAWSNCLRQENLYLKPDPLKLYSLDSDLLGVWGREKILQGLRVLSLGDVVGLEMEFGGGGGGGAPAKVLETASLLRSLDSSTQASFPVRPKA